MSAVRGAEAGVAADRSAGGRGSSAGGCCGVGDGRSTVDDGRVDVALTAGAGITSASAGCRRYARPGVGSVKQLPRCFHRDSFPPTDDDDAFLQPVHTCSNCYRTDTGIMPVRSFALTTIMYIKTASNSFNVV